ncbi:MAG: cell division protein SepF [Collinsella sp.]
MGQTRRGEAESVAVYTRSGQLVGDDSRHATTYNPPSRSQETVAGGYRPGAYDTPSSYAESARARAAAPAPAPSPSDASAYASNIINATPQLPAYVLRPESYDDVETVVRRVRTKQPVALIFVGVRTEVAKRVLTSLTALPAAGATVKEGGRPRVHGAARRLRGQRFRSQEARADGYLNKDKTRRFPSTSTLSSSWSIRCSTSIHAHYRLLLYDVDSHEAGWFASGYCRGA